MSYSFYSSISAGIFPTRRDWKYWLHAHYPEVHVLMLTMYDTDLTHIRLLQAGVRGFLKKDVHPDELKFAIRSVMESGYYYSHTITGKLVNRSAVRWRTFP